MKPAVAYIRVSTQKQGRSGLGLEAQQAALARFAEAEGLAFAETYQEVKTAKGDNAHTREVAVKQDRRPSPSACAAAPSPLRLAAAHIPGTARSAPI